MNGQPTCRHEGCPVAAEEKVDFLGQPRLYCSFHAHRAREHLEGDLDENVSPEVERRDGLYRETDDDAAHVYPFDDESNVGNGFLGRRVAYGQEGTVRISMEYAEESPHSEEAVTVEQAAIPELVAGIVERAAEDQHEELREQFEAALDRAPYEPSETESTGSGGDVSAADAEELLEADAEDLVDTGGDRPWQPDESI
ncbi:MAG: hypothetical protein ABEH78_11345 [Haloferacaceae archaeon]